MSATKVWWTAIGSFIPFALFIILVVLFVLIIPFSNTPNGEPADPKVVMLGFLMVAVLIALALDYLVMTIYLLIDTFSNRHVKDNQTAWVLVILLASYLGFPVYWYVNIFKHRNKNDILTTELS